MPDTSKLRFVVQYDEEQRNWRAWDRKERIVLCYYPNRDMARLATRKANSQLAEAKEGK